MIPDFLDRSLLPHKSGVYIFKDSTHKILYVGKAIDLNKRVASYFSRDLPQRTSVMAGKIASLETIIVESELEALILEANLIKKYTPPFNIRLTDDKDYLYIAITKEEFPKIITARKKDLEGCKKYFGPFPSAKTARDTLKQLRRVFLWCSGTGNRKQATGGRACFYYHLSLCPGACIGVISKNDYNKIINNFSKFMEGKKEELITQLTKEMEEAAKNLNFEIAQKIKKEIVGIQYLTQSNRVHLYLENSNFLEEETKLALKQLQKDLSLEKIPERIECYDISNIQGADATGSMVVLTNGEVDKSQYRKFKIHPPAGGSGKPNDVGMHKEMMGRRLKHPEWGVPDLIIIDGGRGQVRGIQFQIVRKDEFSNEKPNFKFQIPVFGLAKRDEWLYPPEGDIIKLPRKSLSLKLLQKIRDESHRFAISYHRKLRDAIKSQVTSHK